MTRNSYRMSAYIKTAVIMLLLNLPSLANSESATPARLLPSFTTNINVSRYVFFWASDDELIATSSSGDRKSAAGESDAVVRVNYKTQRIDTLINDRAILLFDPRIRRMRIGKLDGHVFKDGEDIDFDGSGSIISRKTLDAGDDALAIVSKNRPTSGLYKRFESPYDGYLVRQTSSDNSTGGASHDASIWIRPNTPGVLVNAPLEEITSPRYMRYLNKYILNDGDSSASSDTNSHLNKLGRAYEFAPTRLMDTQGNVVSIPYPYYLEKYGVGHAWTGAENGTNFDTLIFTAAGEVFFKWTSIGDDIYLYSDQNLYLIASAEKKNDESLPNSGKIDWYDLSPNGCRLAFDYSKEPSRQTSSDRHLTIIDLCNKQR